MPKLKTNKSAAKRFKVTGRGKVLRRRNSVRHLMAGKSSKRKRKLRRAATVHGTEAHKIIEMLPYA